jgi:hypothetical protein
MAINYTKHVELTFNGKEVHCNATSAELTDEPEGSETLQTFCYSEDIAGTPKGLFALSAYQDWGHQGGSPAANDSVFDLVDDAYLAEEEIDVEFTVGGVTKSFSVRPLAAPPFGGEAGSALVGDMEFSVTSDIVKADATP